MVVAAPHSNSLILVGPPEDVAEVKLLVKAIDVDLPSGRGRLHAILLKYLSAEDAAKSLSSLFEKTVEKKAAMQMTTAIPIPERRR